jgi:hypothetical protein
MGFTKTLNHTKESAQETAHAIYDGVDSRRDAAAGLLSRNASRLRKGSKRASRMLEQGGSQVADRMDGVAERVGHKHRGPIGYITGHPLRLFFAAGLIAALVAILLTRRSMAGYEDDDADF